MDYKEHILHSVIRQVLLTNRHKKGLSQTALSMITNTTRQFISQIEVGKRQPSLTSLSNFAAAIDKTLTELFQEIDELYIDLDSRNKD
ncbi:MAG: helix-turn-helix transcriptional regulator [Fibrobacter sp.]|nr:helix-turn-helix transcriptional regulator [Fibrobacter sp.]